MQTLLPDGTLKIVIEEPLTRNQADFILSPTVYCAFVGGWGSGKSHAGAQKAYDLAMINRDSIGLVCGPSYGQVMDTSYAHFVDFLSRNGIPFNERRGGRPAIILPWGDPDRATPGPGWVVFRSLDKPGSIKGITAAWLWIDEAGALSKGEEGWQVATSRVRCPHAILKQRIVTTTAEAPWLEDRFGGAPPGVERDRTVFFKASTLENPTADPADVQDLLNDLPPDMAEVYVYGGFLPPQTGLVYCTFEPGRNISDLAEYSPDLPLWASFDFGKHPHSLVIAQPWLEVEGISFIDEQVLPHTITPAAIEQFYNCYGGHKAEIAIYGDPAGQWFGSNSKTSNYDAMRDFLRHKGRSVRFRYRGHDPGQGRRILAMNRMFCDTLGNVRVRANPRCKNLIYDWQHVDYAANGEINKNKVHPRMGWTLSHPSDAGCYLVEFEFPIVKPTVKKR